MSFNDGNIPAAKRRKLEDPGRVIPQLPGEVWGIILQFVDFASLFSFSSCCTYFRFVATDTLQKVNLFRLKVSKEYLSLLKEAGRSILTLNLSHTSLKAVDLMASLTVMVNLVTLDISHTGLAIPDFIRISQNLPRLLNLTMNLVYSDVIDNDAIDQYKRGFSRLKFIHFYANDFLFTDKLWRTTLSVVEEAIELFELRFTLIHEDDRFRGRNIPQKLRSALKLPFKKLIISTGTVKQDVIFFTDDFEGEYHLGSECFEEFIGNKWQFVLFRASELKFDKITMSQNLFEELKVHCKDTEDQVTVNYDDFGELYSCHCILHMWHPSLFQSNRLLSKEIVLEIEKKIPKMIGNGDVVLGLQIPINEEEWQTLMIEGSGVTTANLVTIVENITSNDKLNIMKNVTAFIIGEERLGSFGWHDFFSNLFLKCQQLETLILRCSRIDCIHIWALTQIKLAKNLKTIQLSGSNFDFGQWLSELGHCKKLENVEFRCLDYYIDETDEYLISRENLFGFIGRSKYLKCMLVFFELSFLQHRAVFDARLQALKDSFEVSIGDYQRRPLYCAAMELPHFHHVDAQCEAFYPIYSKFLKPLQNLKNI